MQTLKELSSVKKLNGPLNQYYNSTHNFHELSITEATESTKDGAAQYMGRLGVVISASADSNIHVYGVKSDKGTGDGFMALPLTETSTEFFVAAWK